MGRPQAAALRAAKRTIVESVRARRPVVYWWDADGFAHRTQGTTILPQIRRGPAHLKAETLNFFCWNYCPKAGDTMLDVGAGFGTELPTFSRLVGPSGRVIAVEAHPSTFTVAKRMVKANKLTNVDLHHLAVWNVSGEITISDVGDANLNSVVHGTYGTGSATVAAVTLDQLSEGLGLDGIDFLKMNIEGAERQAVEGGLETLARTRHVAISCHDFVAEYEGGSEDMRTRAYVHRELVQLGFDVVERDDDPRPFVRSYLFGSR